jgi:alpha-ketoglutarate-dependent 2,4-dichlorophenoxyacetate dioxygenase
MEVRKLHPLFAAELVGADLAEAPDAALIALVEQAMAEHAVLVVRGQTHIGDDEHIRFSRAFGPLELRSALGVSLTGKRRQRPEIFDASNLDADGNIEPADSLKRTFSKANELFHSDSSFHALPTKWSLLLGHIVTPERGETEFVDARAAYAALPAAMRQRIAGLSAEHNVWRSRQRAGFPEADTLKGAIPPAVHPLVRKSASGRDALYIGAHADHIVGLPIEEGRRLLDELLDFASQPRFRYRHRWVKGDLVIWDNRCTLHRAGAFDYLRHKRDLRRTTINEYGEERTAGRLEEPA